jgi:hypothetical protein
MFAGAAAVLFPSFAGAADCARELSKLEYNNILRTVIAIETPDKTFNDHKCLL